MGKRKLLLVSANRLSVPYPVYPIGISYLFCYLETRLPELDIRVFDFNMNSIHEFIETLQEFQPDYTGISFRNIDDVDSYSKKWFIHDYKEIIDIVKKNIFTKIIIGGSAFSIFPKQLFEFVEPDFGISGEGEESLFQLLRSFETNTDPTGIQGLVYRKDNEIRVNPRDTFVKNLNLSFDSGMMDFYWEKSGMMNVQTKRGCPHHCIYCTYPLIEGHKVRTLSIEKIIETLCDLYFNKKIDYVFFTDSVFNLNDKFNRELDRKSVV